MVEQRESHGKQVKFATEKSIHRSRQHSDIGGLGVLGNAAADLILPRIIIIWR